MDKFDAMKCHVIEITVTKHSKHTPLFNFEPVYKTIKAYYHDIKRAVLTDSEYRESGPLFFYDVNRGSGIWKFFGELKHLLVLAVALENEKVIGQSIENLDRKLRILEDHFGERNVDGRLYREFMRSRSSVEIQDAVENLFQEGIASVRVSKLPIDETVDDAIVSLVDLKEILKSSNRR